jgi:hypothetical protein
VPRPDDLEQAAKAVPELTDAQFQRKNQSGEWVPLGGGCSTLSGERQIQNSYTFRCGVLAENYNPPQEYRVQGFFGDSGAADLSNSVTITKDDITAPYLDLSYEWKEGNEDRSPDFEGSGELPRPVLTAKIKPESMYDRLPDVSQVAVERSDEAQANFCRPNENSAQKTAPYTFVCDPGYIDPKENSYPIKFNGSITLNQSDNPLTYQSQVDVKKEGGFRPRADFTWTQESDSKKVNFNATSSQPKTTEVLEGDAEIKEYRWDFGDGATTTTEEATVSHTYDTADKKTVSLTVQDHDAGLTSAKRLDTVQKTIDISTGGDNSGGISGVRFSYEIKNDYNFSAQVLPSSEVTGTDDPYFLWKYYDTEADPSNLIGSDEGTKMSAVDHSFASDGDKVVNLVVRKDGSSDGELVGDHSVSFLLPNNYTDSDGDETPDANDDDRDGDGTNNGEDLCPDNSKNTCDAADEEDDDAEVETIRANCRSLKTDWWSVREIAPQPCASGIILSSKLTGSSVGYLVS